MEEPVLKLKRAVDTRWLSHDQAVTAIRRTLPSLLTCLEREAAQNGDAVARGLVSALGAYNFIATIYLMSDVLPLLTTLSLVFQTEDVDLSVVQPQVAATISSLKLLRNQPGPSMEKLPGVLEELASYGVTVASDHTKKQFQTGVRERYLDSLVENLENRFQDVGVLNAFNLFNPKSATEANEKSDAHFNSYGEGYLDTLAEHFAATIDKEKLQHEWSAMKHVIVRELPAKSTRQVMAMLSGDRTLATLYPTLSRLCSIALVLPVSTAHCERGFSTLKRIKTVPRNRPATDTLDYLIRISAEGCEQHEFDFERAVLKCSAKRNRRLTT